MNNQFITSLAATTSTPQQQQERYLSSITPTTSSNSTHQQTSSAIHQNNGLLNNNNMFYPPLSQQQQQSFNSNHNNQMNNNTSRFFSFPSFQIPTNPILNQPLPTLPTLPTTLIANSSSNQPPFSLFSNPTTTTTNHSNMMTINSDESSRKRSNDEISANNIAEDIMTSTLVEYKKAKIDNSIYDDDINTTSTTTSTTTTTIASTNTYNTYNTYNTNTYNNNNSAIRNKWRLGILPSQVLYQIMTFINRIELIKSVGKVSRHFHRTSRINLLWRSEDITKLIPSLVSMNALVLFHYQVFGMYHNTSPFEQIVLHSIDQASLVQFLSIYTNLKKIKIINRATLINNQLTPCQLKSEALLKICKTFKALIDIDASTLEIEHIEPILTSITDRLEHLNLDHVKSVTFDHVNFLLRNCKHLKTLKCANTPKFSINNEQLYEIATSSKAEKLSTLVVRFLGVDNYEFINLFVKKFKNLKNLQISNWNDLNSLMLTRILNDLECLEQVKIECNENTIISQPISINNSNITSISISKLNKLSNLIFGLNCKKKISLLKFESISHIDLPLIENEELIIENFSIRSSSLNIFQNDKILTALDQCEKLDILDLQSVTQFNLSSKLLTNVQLFMCDQLTFIKFKNCLKLESVSIDACNQLTELDLSNLPKLNELILFKLPSEGHPILNTLSINCGNEFTNLQISRCVNIRNLNLNCPNLNSLNLTDCKILENINLFGTSNLSKVAISLCVYPMDRMNHLFQFFKNVEYLSISNALNLTDLILNEYLNDENSKLQALVLSNCNSLISPSIQNNSIKGLQLLNLNMLDNLHIQSNSLSKLFLRNNQQLKQYVHLQTPKLKLLQVQNCQQLPSITMDRLFNNNINTMNMNTMNNMNSNMMNGNQHDLIHQAHFDGCPMLNYIIFNSTQSSQSYERMDRMDQLSLDSYKMIIDDYLMKDCPNLNFYMSLNGQLMKMYQQYNIQSNQQQHIPIVLQTTNNNNNTIPTTNNNIAPHHHNNQYQQQQHANRSIQVRSTTLPPPILQQVPKQQLTLGLVPPPQIVYNQEFQ